MNAHSLATPGHLQDWLRWQEGLHDRSMDLGLERIGQVWARLAQQQPLPLLISVAGTNGKGSVVAMLEAILSAAGYRVGSYTSPCLLSFAEQIRVAAEPADELALCAAFQRVEDVRGGTPLTSFEFSTLVALSLFQHSELDVALLEVGLGGREDAVNVVDADAALITTVDLDHQAWLGADRDSIGWHKAGIFRPGKPAVCADPDPPGSVLEYARQIGATLIRRGVDFDGSPVDTQQWCWSSAAQRLELPRPGLPGDHQLDNAAGVLALLDALSAQLPVGDAAIAEGLCHASLPGRGQISGEPVQWWLDVAHNRQSLAALARSLENNPRAGLTRAVVAMRGDKDAGALSYLADRVDVWYPASLNGSRGRSGSQLAGIIGDSCASPPPKPYDDVLAACSAAARDAVAGDRIVVFGSFLTVAAVLEADPMRQWNHG